MKKLTVITLSLIAAGTAMANGLTREQVIADLVQARVRGNLAFTHREDSSAFGLAVIDTQSTVSRAAVLADLKQARDSGELDRRSRESYEPAVTTGFVKTRAQVIAELRQARADGELEADSNQGGYAHLASLRKANANQLLAGKPASVR